MQSKTWIKWYWLWTIINHWNGIQQAWAGMPKEIVRLFMQKVHNNFFNLFVRGGIHCQSDLRLCVPIFHTTMHDLLIYFQTVSCSLLWEQDHKHQLKGWEPEWPNPQMLTWLSWHGNTLQKLNFWPHVHNWRTQNHDGPTHQTLHGFAAWIWGL